MELNEKFFDMHAKHKETVQKILLLLDGWKYLEADSVLRDARGELAGKAIFSVNTPTTHHE